MLNVKRVVVESTDGKEVWVTPAQVTALTALSEMQGGGCAALHGYKPTTGYVTPPVIDIQMLTRFSYAKLIERKRTALEGITFSEVQDAIAKNDKLSALTVVKANEVFETRKGMLLASINKTLDGDRSDAHRQGHDRCYATFAGGIKGHLVTEKGEDGLMHPVTLNRIPILQNIMVNYLELNRKVVTEGVSKPKPNSGAPVLMGNAISSLLNQRSVGFKTASLKDDNFDSLVMSKTEFLPEDVAPNVLDLLKD
jgi:hypothetical protein